jgi:hypothetical protein
MPRGRPPKTVRVDAPPKEKKEAICDFLKELTIVTDQMGNLRDHMKDFKGSYIENGWLSKEEIQLIQKAFRLFNSDVDISELEEYYKKVTETVLSGFRVTERAPGESKDETD